MIEGPVVEQFYYILETFLMLWLYQQSIKYFAIYEVLGNWGRGRIVCAHWRKHFSFFKHKTIEYHSSTKFFLVTYQVKMTDGKILSFFSQKNLLELSDLILDHLSILFLPFHTNKGNPITSLLWLHCLRPCCPIEGHATADGLKFWNWVWKFFFKLKSF